MQYKFWNENEINILKQYYPISGLTECINLLPNRTKSAIKKKAHELQIHCNFKWTDENNAKLKELWYNASKQELLDAFPTLSYNAIQFQACERMKFPHNIDRRRHGNLSFMNNLNNKEVYYWWGFFIADGCISQKNEFIISISNRDKNNLQLLANRLNTTIREREADSTFGKYTTCSIRIGDKCFCEKWKKIFNLIDKQKTYNSPNISIFYDKTYLIYFLIGFLDGDGCISKSRTGISISISNHISWKPLYVELFDIIDQYYNINFHLRIDNHGCIQACFSRKNDVIKLYNYAIQCSDILHRKWDKIKEQFNL